MGLVEFLLCFCAIVAAFKIGGALEDIAASYRKIANEDD